MSIAVTLASGKRSAHSIALRSTVTYAYDTETIVSSAPYSGTGPGKGIDKP